tara:strand:- start:200 stop:628 length:429 start_codon:yes stop_codon:yes gene_type:complete
MKYNLENIHLKHVSKVDYEFLYEMLAEREPISNISHKKMPSFRSHQKFVLSKPYKKWYIVKHSQDSIGSLYLSHQNEIGFFLKKQYNDVKTANFILKLFMKKNPQSEYFVNINPKNKKLINFYKNFGFSLLQKTFKLEKNSK